LLPSTTYQFQLVSTNADGMTEGADQTFTTPATPAETVTVTPGAFTATARFTG